MARFFSGLLAARISVSSTLLRGDLLHGDGRCVPLILTKVGLRRLVLGGASIGDVQGTGIRHCDLPPQAAVSDSTHRNSFITRGFVGFVNEGMALEQSVEFRCHRCHGRWAHLGIVSEYLHCLDLVLLRCDLHPLKPPRHRCLGHSTRKLNGRFRQRKPYVDCQRAHQPSRVQGETTRCRPRRRTNRHGPLVCLGRVVHLCQR
mmetsp:Transcript_84878/g.169583  ORF Transcript_84878/g.169583 Transcript_84878/m.169583 type:complete len:203 (+) Transcript_84878:188-796(+)